MHYAKSAIRVPQLKFNKFRPRKCRNTALTANFIAKSSKPREVFRASKFRCELEVLTFMAAAARGEILAAKRPLAVVAGSAVLPSCRRKVHDGGRGGHLPSSRSTGPYVVAAVAAKPLLRAVGRMSEICGKCPYAAKPRPGRACFVARRTGGDVLAIKLSVGRMALKARRV